jgi:hypothetical protein
VLLRLDSGVHEAETRALQGDLALRALQLRRIDAELADRPLLRQPGDMTDGFARADAQYRANRTSYLDALAQESSAVSRTTQDLRAALAVLNKLQRTVPIYQTMAERYATLQSEGYIKGDLFALERSATASRREQDLAAQEHSVESLRQPGAGARGSSRSGPLIASSCTPNARRPPGSADVRKRNSPSNCIAQKAVELRAPQAAWSGLGNILSVPSCLRAPFC